MNTFFTYDIDKEKWGSTIMRGFNISKLLNIKIIPNNKINNVVNKKIICLKSNDYIKYLKYSVDNEIIIDMVDFKLFSQLNILKNFSHGIFTSNSQLKKYGGYFKNPDKNVVIYHHWDERLTNIKITDLENIKIGYFGIVKKCYLYNKIDDIEYNILDGNTFKNNLKLYEKYNVHYIIKPKEQEDLIQSTLKLSNASTLGCPVICYKEEQYVELLTEDYPYYCLSYDKNDILEMIEFIKKTYKKDEWFKSLEILKNIKNETSLDNTVKKYNKMIK